MFMLRNVSKYLFGDTSKESVIEIPQGQLYLVRPLSPKGYSELIFRDAAASIRRTGLQFQYQLAIQRVYEEGEEELLAEEAGESGAEEVSIQEKDERTFLLDESLRFRTDLREGGELVFAWQDLSGDPGDTYEFICDPSIQPSAATSFELVAAQCQYERKYRQSAKDASEADLKEFSFAQQEVPDAGAASLGRTPGSSPANTIPRSNSAIRQEGMPPTTPSKAVSAPSPKAKQTEAPTARKEPSTNVDLMANEIAELHLFDFESGAFILQDPEVRATVLDLGQWNYWLHIKSKDRDWLGQPVLDELNPVFNFEYLSFIFNHYTEDGSAYSWLLRFRDQNVLDRFQQGVMQALWQHLNQIQWAKAKEEDRDYILEAFQDLTMEDADAAERAEDEEEEDESDEDEAAPERNEDYDSDESQEDVDVKGKSKDANSLLTVGYKHGRSFVVRGSKIGVFAHTPDNNLKFSTNISKVTTPNGKKLFSPKKAMLHQEDTSMILQDPSNANALYRMDLETGKVVDEWKVHDDIPINNFAPETKFAQMTNEQTFLGLSHNALYRVDPRLAGAKLVDADLKQYATKTDFSAAATTDKGYIAVASNKGDIRMFDRLGLQAKTALPVLGDPIVGLDVSADGRWVLATTKTYLLLVDALQKDGKNAGKLGFEKPFAKDQKPQPRRLALSPSHVAQFQHETKAPIAFTPARFNTGVDSNETTIVTATGPFVVTWSMKKVLKAMKDPYSIKRYEEVVKADDFKYGTDKNMIVALPNEVGMVSKGQLKRPTRESIIGTPLRSSGATRTPARKSRLRDEIVDSPY